MNQHEQATEKDGDVQKTFQGDLGDLSIQFEGLNDGYRFTLRAKEEELKNQRRVGAAIVNVAKQAEKAGWKLPWFFRLILWFWERYK